jgi:hypothetical protein
MTTYRLLNDIFNCHEAFVDFKTLRRQFNDVKVWFPQENTALTNKLKSEWIPVDVTFTSDRKGNAIPDISVWNLSCLVLSTQACNLLKPLLSPIGEFLPLNNGFYLYNCLSAVSGDAVDQSKTSFQIEHSDSTHIPKSLTFLPAKIMNQPLFKPSFAENSFLICQDEFKELVIKNNLTGLIFSENLAQIFPTKD